MTDYIKHGDMTSYDKLNAQIYDDLGYNQIVPFTGGKTRGEVTKTSRYDVPIPHPTSGEFLMRIKPVTCWHLDGSFTTVSPADYVVEGGSRDGLPVLSITEKADMKTKAEWEAEGFFSAT